MMIKTKLISILFFSLFLLLAGCSNESAFNKSLPADTLELSRYLGTWYEIARIPNWFEKDLLGVTVTYTLKKDGHIEVRNAGNKTSLTGEKQVAIGDAWVPDSSETGRLKVSFFWPFAADYIVLDLDDNCHVAMVGSGKDFLWILCRKPILDEAVYLRLLAKAKGLGFDITRLERVKQNP